MRLRPSLRKEQLMARIEQILEQVDESKPNDISEKQKLRWIAELDGKIALDVMLMAPQEAQQFHYHYPEGMGYEPLVSFPHDGIYAAWLAAKIDFANGEFERYENSMAMYNAEYSNFVSWFLNNYDPVQGYRKVE